MAHEKLKELILYIVQQSDGDPHFDFDKLKAILFRADFLAYRDLGKSITGEVYVKEPPCPPAPGVHRG